MSSGSSSAAPPTADQGAAPAPAPVWRGSRATAVPLPLSAGDPGALRERAGQLRAFFLARPDVDPSDTGGPLASAATAEHRAVVLGADRDEAVRGLAALAEGRDDPALVRGRAAPARVVFVFPGQGPQWAGMAVELLDSSPLFAARLRECGQALDRHVDWSLDEVLRGAPGAPALERADVVQPALFAVMVALAELWRAHGVEPDAVLGHSLGEIAAAHVAGALSLDDAARVVSTWSRAQATLAGRGDMAMVPLSVDELRPRLAGFGDRVAVAGVNGPRSTAISGDSDAVAEVLAGLAADGVAARLIPVGLAAHSPHITALRGRLMAGLAPIRPRTPVTPMYSSVTEGWLDDAPDPAYWYRNLRGTVRFESATRGLLDSGHRIFVEVSPHPVLAVGVQGTIDAARTGPDGACVLGTLRSGAGGMPQFLASLAEAHVRGVEADWGVVSAARGTRPVVPPAFAPAPVDRAAAPRGPAPSLRDRLAGADDRERERELLDLVLAQTGLVLGSSGHGAVEPGLGFQQAGLDSLGAVRLRNRLAEAAGLALPATLVFDHPTPATVARHLRAELFGPRSGTGEGPSPVPTAADEPIAIVAAGCRFPGGVRSPEDLWELLTQGRDAVSGFPTDRGWDLGEHHDPDRAGGVAVREGGFLHDAAGFDAAFFGIGPREALLMDPQQRLLLETSWEAFERAGIDPGSLRGSPTGVFVGAMTQDYGPRMHEAGEEAGGYVLTGNAAGVASGRLAYAFGLEGPTVTVDTACSSSLVALHLAGQALRAGECSLALAGGVTVMATPGMIMEFSRKRALSPDGRCRAFAAGSEGFGLAEGAGVLVLERLSDARRNGHPVLALIRGSAVNQDGASNGLTAPNGTAQQRVIRRALANAGLGPADVDAVEAHGTGTPLGDPVEANALIAVYGGRERAHPLRLGSLKSNIGHTQAASGVAGVIKTVMALRHGVLPESLHIGAPNPRVDWGSGSVELLTEAAPWPDTGRPRRAGVSSFGVSGTNAHVLVEQAEPPAARSGPDGAAVAATGSSSPLLPWVLSARSEAALRGQAARLRARLDEADGAAPADVGFSLATGRAAFDHRAVVLAADRSGFLRGLDALAEGRPDPGVVRGSSGRAPARTVFVFPGQGSQWAGMALDLLASAPVFAERMAECERALSPHVDWSLSDVVRGAPGAPPLERVDVVQPALFAVMVSLARLWESRGVRPDAVVGHSQGEIAAACVAGALSLDDAARVAALRSRTLLALAGHGGMVSVALPEARVAERLPLFGGRVCVAAVNGPRSTVVAGPGDALDALALEWAELGVTHRRIPVDYASHSPDVEVVRADLEAALKGISPRAADVPFYSSVTGGVIDTRELDPSYWYRNLRLPVRFGRAARALVESGHTVFVEVSAHPVLLQSVQDTLDDAGADGAAVLGSLRRGDGGPERFLTSLAEAHVHGAEVDWTTVLPPAERVDLPTYAFQHQRYWIRPRPGGAPAAHPLLESSVPLAHSGGRVFTGRLSGRGWLADHAVGGAAVVPGAAFAEMALHAGGRVGCGAVAELTLHAPLVLPERGGVAVQLAVEGPGPDGGRSFTVHSRAGADPDGADAPWVRHADGLLAVAGAAPPDDAGAWPPPGSVPVDLDGFYAGLERRGYGYGPAFRGLTAAWRRGGEVFAEAARPEAGGTAGYGIHPALLDAALHTVLVDEDGAAAPGVRLPFAWRGVRLHASGADALRVRLTPTGAGVFSVRLNDARGAPVATVDSLAMRTLPGGAVAAPGDGGADLYALEWVGAPPGSARPAVRWALVGARADGSGGPLDAALLAAAREAGAARYADLAALRSAVAAGAPVPGTVLTPVPGRSSAPSGLADAVRETTLRALALVRDWLADDAPAPGRLVVVTRGAVAARPGEDVADLAAAPVWGLLRSARTEHPDRFALVDLDGSDDSADALPSAVAGTAGGEAQLAVRGGAVLAPRLARAPGGPAVPAAGIDPDGTVLVTGGTGTLGRLLARHLVAAHGVRRLLLVGRGGASSPGAAALREELAGQGAEAVPVSCDAADADALAALLASIPDEHPLTAVVHAAGTLDDAAVSALTEEKVDRVLRPKAAAALNLHALTADRRLAAFVLFSSVSGVLGGAGQGNYAAANAFLDALAHHRRFRGLPATSLAWGLWAEASAMTGHLSEADRARLGRTGLAPMDSAAGLALFDAALRDDRPVLVPARLDLRGLGGPDAPVPPVLRSLARGPVRRAAGESAGTGPDLARRLAPLSPSEREHSVLDLVRSHAAAVLGHASPDAVHPARPFTEIGFDSLTAVELRNRLNAATGLRLPSTLLFDHPEPAAAARLVLGELFPGEGAGGDAAAREESTAAAIDAMDVDDLINLAMDPDGGPPVIDLGD
ncbi:type I polyketide synthase [Actinorugispora endophytica]|uniref:Acyl transferase domain-containing protein n=1 Tax=Actinorugispora endophytica TaxID=1605990 RepID=A0A4R6UWB0_9ACTN|nr:type I polyketide synthase [Actinorugispora endophytica]TDQ51640.1 acyl transferase domain-containing protein [Actinorugispora endophytica]